MKQFWSVLRFELGGYFKAKVYLFMTVLLVLVLAGVLSFPNIKAMFAGNDTPDVKAPVTRAEQLADAEPGDDVIAIVNPNDAVSGEGLVLLANAMSGRPMRLVTDDADAVRDQVKNGEYAGAVVIEDPQTATYIARNLELGDDTVSMLYGALADAVRYEKLAALSIPGAEAEAIVNPVVNISVDNLGVSQEETFFYTYIMLMALYMAIMIFGQMVATSVATEKSSRTMELLITSASTNSLMFGKMIASGVAGLVQMAVLFGSGVLFYNLNASAWAGNAIVASIFNMPLPIVGYVLLFFLLGYFLYAFMFGAIGSLVSRVEDISTSIMPVLMIFIFAFIAVITAMTSGNANGALMITLSYIPFTAPMAMFVRIAMAAPAWYEIVISIAILLATTAGIGILSASIYRMGVLMYGKPPRPSELIKVVRMARRHEH